jgi:hypothetical protein
MVVLYDGKGVSHDELSYHNSTCAYSIFPTYSMLLKRWKYRTS